MKRYLITLAVVGVFSATIAFAQGGYSGGVKPIVNKSPKAEEHISVMEAKRFNSSKTKNLVISQFNVNFMDEDNISIRSGGTKASVNDAQINLAFKVVNFDKNMLQAATDELYDYLVEKFTAAGYTFLPYEKLKADENYAKLEITPALNGGKTTCTMSEARPGYFYNMPAALGFSAKKNPTINVFGMKGMKLIKAGKNLDANILSFGMLVHFLEWEGSANKFGKAEVTLKKPQLFFQMTSLGLLVQPGYVAMANQKDAYGYTFDEEFVTSINEGANQSVINNAIFKTTEYTIDNDKFKAAFLKLGKSYIDNMLLEMIK